MNKKLIAILLFSIVLFIACIYITNSNKDTSYIPPLQIVGDVEEAVTLWEFPKDIHMDEIEKDNKKIKAMNLEDIILLSKPMTENNDVLLVGIDGLMSKIDGRNLEKSYIAFSNDNGWEAINYNHTISSNVKHLKEIVIVSNDDRLDIGMNIIDSEKNIKNLTVGELYAGPSTILPYFEGESKKEKGGKTYSTTVYTQRRILKVKDILEDYKPKKALVMGDRGEIKYIDEYGYFEANKNHIDYVGKDGKEKVEKIKGVIIDPPKASITDSYYDISHYIEEEDVLFLFLDGFGYHQYEYALENGYLPFLSNIEKGKKALSVYKPVTNAGFAAMITGKSPVENGVYSRKQRKPKVDSIFKLVSDLDKKSVLLEGDIKILDTEIDPVLNIDRNKNGTTDDEVYQSTLKSIDEGYNLVFAHFHGIDDAGHNYGDLSKETMKVIARTDEYIKELALKFEGKIIITADHGMHSVKDGGDHGEFRYEDMIVPYIILEGGLSNE